MSQKSQKNPIEETQQQHRLIEPTRTKQQFEMAGVNMLHDKPRNGDDVLPASTTRAQATTISQAITHHHSRMITKWLQAIGIKGVCWNSGCNITIVP